MPEIASFVNPPKKADCRINKCLIGISIIIGSGPRHHTGSSLSAIADLHEDIDYPFSEAIHLIGDSIQRFNLALYTIKYIEGEIDYLQKEVNKLKETYTSLDSQKNGEIEELEARISDLIYLKPKLLEIDKKQVTKNDVLKVLGQEIANVLLNIINFESETVASLKIKLSEWYDLKTIEKTQEKQAEALCEVIAYFYNDLAIDIGSRWLTRNHKILDKKTLIMFSSIENFTTKKDATLLNIEKGIDDIYFDSSFENSKFLKGINDDVDMILGRFSQKLKDVNLEMQRLFIKIYLKKECAIIGYKAVETKSKYFSYPSEKLNTLMLVNEYVISQYRRNLINWLQIKIKQDKTNLEIKTTRPKKTANLPKTGLAFSFFTNKMPDQLEIKKVREIAQPEIANQFSAFCFNLLMSIIKEKQWSSSKISTISILCDFANHVKKFILDNPFLHKNFSANAELDLELPIDIQSDVISFYTSLLNTICQEANWDSEKINHYIAMLEYAKYVKDNFIEVVNDDEFSISSDKNSHKTGSDVSIVSDSSIESVKSNDSILDEEENISILSSSPPLSPSRQI